ncbi:hypothetical protein JTB14_007009 [Gonioctena quinquepunctata]|nr:hypothetical protein JTB14_007009 [Gonioctena quinquepunctata]
MEVGDKNPVTSASDIKTISIWLVIVLMNDTFWRDDDDFDLSRKTALALGLDWQHLHEKGSISREKDPEGKMISIIVMFHSAAFLAINMLLLFGTINASWYCAMPWLICEFLTCVSKLGALIYHMYCDHLGKLFFVGSIVYIVVMVWWWFVVFFAQLLWRHGQKWDYELEMTSISIPKAPEEEPATFHNYNDSTILDSPGPYQENRHYARI